MTASSQRLSPSRTARSAETSDRILSSALRLFAEQGFHGTTIPEVMRAAEVGAGSLYRLFPSKEALVNAVFRDAKGRLELALRDGLDLRAEPRALFDAFWARLSAFAEAEPVAFRFLELQDHVPYLDGESRTRELAVLMPILVACLDFQRRGVLRADLGADAAMALVWGAFVGLVKAERLGYLKRDPQLLAAARDACWRALAASPEAAPETPRSGKRRSAPTERDRPTTRRKQR